jgi:hypothetical protein
MQTSIPNSLTAASVMTVVVALLVISGWSNAGNSVTGQGIGIFLLSLARLGALLLAVWASGARGWTLGARIVAVVVTAVAALVLDLLALDHEVERRAAVLCGVAGTLAPALLIAAGYGGNRRLLAGLGVAIGLVAGHRAAAGAAREEAGGEPAH